MTERSDLGTEAREAASDLGHRAANLARRELQQREEDARSSAAQRVQEAADAADAAAEQFPAGSVQAQAVQQVADQIEGFAHSLRTTDVSSSMRQVSNFARENPAIFLAGAAIIGFAATRFLKARSPAEAASQQAFNDPWTRETPHGPDDIARPQGDRSNGAS